MANAAGMATSVTGTLIQMSLIVLLGLGVALLAIPALGAALNGLLPTLILSPAVLSSGLAIALLVTEALGLFQRIRTAVHIVAITTTMRTITRIPATTRSATMNCLNCPISSSAVVTSIFWPVQSALGTVCMSFIQ